MKKVILLLAMIVVLAVFVSCEEETPEKQPSIALNGTFSVGPEKTVVFSKGMLYWDGSSFKVEENQTSCFQEWDEKHVNRFYWTTSAEASYGETNTEATTAEDEMFLKEGNSIKVSGEMGWYVLSSEEWTYLFSGRPEASSKLACAKIDTERGLVILPDDWTEPEGVPTFKPGNTDYGALVYTPELWKEMEKAGAVFLFAANMRTGTSIDHSTGLKYWESSLSSYQANGANAQIVSIDYAYHTSGSSLPRANYAAVIRLVKNI